MVFRAKKSKEKNESAIYHIILRGINRQIIFEDEEDNTKILQTLNKYKNKIGYKTYGYCLMGDRGPQAEDIEKL